MPIPDYQSIMLPLLQYAGDSHEHQIRQATIDLAEYFALSEEERTQLYPTGTKEIFYDRVNWAKSYLKKALLLEFPRRGYFSITSRGKAVLSQNPSQIDVRFLRQFPEFVESMNPSVTPQDNFQIVESDLTESTPEEAIEANYFKVRSQIKEELLEKITQMTPSRFERLVVELLVKMGYGTGEAIRRSGDEGIDGIISEDKLGLETVYIQAKRWEGTVGRPEIQRFAGALQGQRAKKGVFITASKFSAEAKDYVSRIDIKVVLVDGEKLADFMIDHNVGVSVERVYEIKKVDSDYFDSSI